MSPSSRLLTPVIIAASSLAASAAVTVTTQTFSITSEILNIPTTATTFNKFDASTGRTLTGVEITYSLTVLSGSVIADNDGASGFTATITGSLAGTLSQGLGIFLPSNVSLADQSQTTVFLAADNGDGPGVVDGTGPDGNIFSIVGLTDTKSLTVDPALAGGFFFNQFIGTGTETFALDYTGSRTVNITGGAAEGGYTTSSVNGFITVSYTSIPEIFSSVATASVLLLGFVGYRPRRDAQAT